MSLTTFQVKGVAASLMVIDHLGFVLGNDLLRMFGRFSFPLFAWLLILGEQKTRNWKRYEWRLLAMALISQPL
ncbi:MAG: TraX family protein, partial [Cyanobacteria bacterium]|nr:TraX family protein [Cyanobacteria bacterium GSL.Bin21]